MTPVQVGPLVDKPTHHLRLTDAFGFTVGLIAVNTKNEPDDSVIARNPVERSSLKTSTGQSQYSDLRPPYMAIVQVDWSGGRASAKFEDDATKFFDSLRVNTGRAGQVILQGRETYGTGFRGDICQLPGSMKLMALVDTRRHLAIRKSASATFPAVQIWAWVRYIGKPTADLTIRLRADNAGAISTVLQTATLAVTAMSSLVSELRKITITGQAIASGTVYWVEVYGGASDDEENHWEVGVKAVTGTTYKSTVGSTWTTAANMDLYFRVVEATADGDGFYFDYKNSKYFISKPANGTASKLWINGARGAAISNATNKLKLNAQGSPGWVVNDWVGGIVVVNAGTGSTETQNWRLITANDANSLTVSEAWLITHDTTTEFVVIGVDKWTKITGHGLTHPVTCVKVSSKNVVYFCQGELAYIRQMREYNNAGTWTREYGYDSTNKAIFLEEYNENGVMNLIRSNGDTTVSKNIVSRTMTGTLTSGTMIIKELTDTSKLIVGMKITGTGVGVGSTIASIDSPTQITGTVNSTAMGTSSSSVTFASSQTGTLTTGANTVTSLTSTALLLVGMRVTGTGVGAGAVIATITSSTALTLTVLSLASGAQTLTFKQTQTGKIASGDKIISELSDTSTLVAAMPITGKNIGAGAVIATVDSLTQVTADKDSIGTASYAITFTQGTPDWGTALSFEAAKFVGNAWDRITNLHLYVDEQQEEAVWVLKEGGPWVWKGGTTDSITDSLDRIKLDEFSAIASAKNGRAAVSQNVYLWYSVANSIHRFYHPTLDDFGPTLDKGMPVGRQGPIVSVFAYPGRLFIAIDAGATGYSSVLENNGGSSWHELYRAPYGERILAIGFQVIPGSSPDRLWIRQGYDMVWMPFPSDTFDPYQDTNFTFAHEGVLTLASMYAGLMDAWKNWHAIKTHAENLVENVTWLEADYRLDDEADWHSFPDKFEEVPISTVLFGSEFGASSKKIDIRIRFYSTDQTKSPKLLAVIVEAVAVTAPKFAFTIPVKMSVRDLQANVEDLQPYERIQKLDEWSGAAQPLLLGANNPLYDGLKVFLQPLPARPMNIVQTEKESDYIISMVIQEA